MYRLVVFSGAPTLAFAHYHSAPIIFSQHFEPYPNRLEITYNLTGDIHSDHPDSKFVAKAPCILFFSNDHPFRTWCEHPPHQHLTFGLDGEYTVRTISAEEVLQLNLTTFPQKGLGRKLKTTLLLCDHLPAEHHAAHLEGLFRQIVETHAQKNYTSELRATMLMYEIFAYIAEEIVRSVMRSSNNFSPSNERYVQLAKEYISANLSQKIMVSDIARHVQISPNYLSSIFKAYTGQSLVDYINRIKIEQAKELLLSNKNFLLREIAEMLGITDENYLSRLFKRYTNMSIRTFLQKHRRQNDTVEGTDPRLTENN